MTDTITNVQKVFGRHDVCHAQDHICLTLLRPLGRPLWIIFVGLLLQLRPYSYFLPTLDGNIMLVYDAADLLAVNQDLGPSTKTVRKTLFHLQLWRPSRSHGRILTTRVQDRTESVPTDSDTPPDTLVRSNILPSTSCVQN